MNTIVSKAFVLLLVIGGLSIEVQAQTGAHVCNALVTVGNDLYLVSATGTPLARFTSDGKTKDCASLAPDGSKVAFLPHEDQNTFAVADGAGRVTFYPAAASEDNVSDDPSAPSNLAQATLIAIAWANADTIRLDKHVGKDTDWFEFYKVPDDLPSQLHQASSPGLGTVCVMASKGRRTACLQGNEIVVDGVSVFSENGTDASPLDSMTLVIGGSASVLDAKGLQVQVTSIQEGVTLRVTLPTGNWVESRVAPGGFLTVPLEDSTLRIFPTVTDSTRGAVELVVLSSSGGPNVFNNALAWLPRAESLLVSKNTAAGSELMLLGSDSAGWRPLGHAHLGVPETIETIRFVSPTLLYFESNSRFGLVPVNIPASPSESVLTLGDITALPTDIDVVKVNGAVGRAAVLTWACN